MITQKQIENLGFNLVGISANGGSKSFMKNGENLKVLKFHGDNYIYKQENNEKLNEISFEKIDEKTLKFNLVYKFNTDDFSIFEEKLKLHGFL
jgi:hypothetical protein